MLLSFDQPGIYAWTAKERPAVGAFFGMLDDAGADDAVEVLACEVHETIFVVP